MVLLWFYMVDKKDLLLVSLIIALSLSFMTNLGSYKSANAQTSSCYSGVIMPSSPNNAIPVILIHGYHEDYRVWSEWETLLKDNVPYCTVSFKGDDECGTATDHARELNKIVQRLKNITHQKQVNLVGHSKGGLDARVYLAENQTLDVANLIMIGTPNRGSPLADFIAYFISLIPWFDLSSFFCTPALYDWKTDAPDTRVTENPHTSYYTIYGNWNPLLPCGHGESEGIVYPILNFIGYTILNFGHVPNDGIVPKWSVEQLNNYTNLGYTFHCHTDLLGGQEYNISKSVLISGR
jgi:pimeloyl-ACP methyl ester carboxylesterase